MDICCLRISIAECPCMDIRAFIDNWRLTFKNHGYPYWYPWIFGNPCMDLPWILGPGLPSLMSLTSRRWWLPWGRRHQAWRSFASILTYVQVRALCLVLRSALSVRRRITGREIYHIWNLRCAGPEPTSAYHTKRAKLRKRPAVWLQLPPFQVSPPLPLPPPHQSRLHLRAPPFRSPISPTFNHSLSVQFPRVVRERQYPNFVDHHCRGTVRDVRLQANIDSIKNSLGINIRVIKFSLGVKTPFDREFGHDAIPATGSLSRLPLFELPVIA